MISFSSSGSTARTEKFLAAMVKGDIYRNLEALAQEGVVALRSATPVESGLTADSWDYEIDRSTGSVAIWWTNTNVVNGFHVAIGLQYGHATGTGGWVQGYDFINPAIKSTMDKIADSVWKEVQNA